MRERKIARVVADSVVCCAQRERRGNVGTDHARRDKADALILASLVL